MLPPQRTPDDTSADRFQYFFSLEHSLGAPRFYLRYEPDIAEFLTRNTHLAARSQYRHLAEGLHFYLWKPRLSHFTRRTWRVNATLDELLYALRSFEDYFDLLNRLPAMARIAGKIWIARHRAQEYVLRANVAAHQKSSRDTVKFYLAAAHQLERSGSGDFRDLANIAHNRSHALQAQAFALLRKKPVADHGRALRAFQAAALHAKRGERLLRRNQIRVSSQHRHFLRYWQHLSASAASALRARHAAADSHLDLAVRYAKQLPAFPKRYFFSFEDLENHRLLLKAYETFQARNDLRRTYLLLTEWLARSVSIQHSGRYARVAFRARALEMMLAWDEELSVRQQFNDLSAFLKSRRIFGKAEIYILHVLEGLITGDITREIADLRFGEVFVLDAVPPQSWLGYLDGRSVIEKALLRLPSFFGHWLTHYEVEGNSFDDVSTQEALYILLLYVRSIVEFWTSVYAKRVEEGRASRSSGVVSSCLSLVGWTQLTARLEDLATLFSSVPGLRRLADELHAFLPELSNLDTMDIEEVRGRVLQLICATEWPIFPHPIRLEEVQPAHRGKVQVRVRRFWNNQPTHLKITFRARLNQELIAGAYYYLKPTYRKVSSWELEQDCVLFPFRPATAFGVPTNGRTALLLEGIDDQAVFSALLNHVNPHWRARITILTGRGSGGLRTLYRNVRSSFSEIVAVGDAVGGIEDLEELRRLGVPTFVLTPDLEGVEPQTLRRGLRELAALELDEAEITAIVGQAIRQERGTLNCLRDYLTKREGRMPSALWDLGRLKRELAARQGELLVVRDLPEQVLLPIEVTLAKAFGHISPSK